MGVPEEKQVEYIRKLALYHLNHAKWRKNFDDSECPEVTVTKPIEKHLCGEHCDEVVIEPEPPLTLCDFKPEFPGCKEGPNEEPDCETNPKLCQPPRYCDLEPWIAECAYYEEEECKEGSDSLKCRLATKCDNEEFKDAENCEMPNPCLADPALCLTICDNANH